MSALLKKTFIISSSFFIAITTFALVKSKQTTTANTTSPAVLGSVINEEIASPSAQIEGLLDPQKLFDLVNSYRQKNDLPTFEEHEPLCEYAKRRSEEIKDDWSHDKFYDDVRGNKINNICPECYRAGENLAHYYSTEEEIIEAWIDSPSHKKNLDDDWNWACVAIADNIYAALIFGKQK